MATQLDDPGFKRHPRPRGGPLEDQRHGPTRERRRAIGRGLELKRPIEQLTQLGASELGPGEEVARQAEQSTYARPVRVLTWNLFHGRAVPPAGRELFEEFA